MFEIGALTGSRDIPGRIGLVGRGVEVGIAIGRAVEQHAGAIDRAAVGQGPDDGGVAMAGEGVRAASSLASSASS